MNCLSEHKSVSVLQRRSPVVSSGVFPRICCSLWLRKTSLPTSTAGVCLCRYCLFSLAPWSPAVMAAVFSVCSLPLPLSGGVGVLQTKCLSDGQTASETPFPYTRRNGWGCVRPFRDFQHCTITVPHGFSKQRTKDCVLSETWGFQCGSIGYVSCMSVSPSSDFC